MLGIIVALALSWLILWLFHKESIIALGLIPNQKRIKGFVLGFIVMAFLCSFNHLIQAYFQDVSYIRNPNYGMIESLKGTWWAFKAALFEELIFRGAILYFLIRKLGGKWACVISAIAFGIYHWFSYEMFGRGLIPMTYVFLLTGAGGWMFAFAFYKTKSILAPLGLHFGWIFMSIVVFSAGPLGDSLFLIEGIESGLGAWEQLFAFLFQSVFVPGIVTWYLVKNYNEKVK